MWTRCSRSQTKLVGPCLSCFIYLFIYFFRSFFISCLYFFPSFCLSFFLSFVLSFFLSSTLSFFSLGSPLTYCAPPQTGTQHAQHAEQSVRREKAVWCCPLDGDACAGVRARAEQTPLALPRRHSAIDTKPNNNNILRPLLWVQLLFLLLLPVWKEGRSGVVVVGVDS